ncbi:MAG: alpha/beta hydrolase [Chloroflexi bacterium]|nr:alpha/beta hydrolase [Chloroflexota bacterium]
MPRIDELRFRAGDLSLAATLTLPEGEGRLPWVLLVPSWLPRNRDGDLDRQRHPDWFAPAPAIVPDGLFARLAGGLAERGVASLRYDPRGCGESDGSWEASDLFSRIDDARDAIGAMRSRRELDLRRTAIVGHGEGAAVAMSVAIGDPAIGAVGLIGASARGYRDVLRRGAAERERTARDREHPFVAALDRVAEELIERAERREPTVAIGMADLNLAAWEQAFRTPPVALATMLHRNIVLAHGTADAWSHPDESRILAQVLEEGENDPILQLVESAGHELAEADRAAVGAFTAALVARMEPRELPPVLIAIEQMG